MYGIYAPYSYRDATDAALTLADFLGTKQTPRLSWLSPTPPGTGIDSAWDGHVLNEQRGSFEDWAKGRKTIVWFTTDAPRLEIARRAKCRNVLAVMWHDLKTLNAATLMQYDLIVVPDKVVQQWLDKLLPGIYTTVLPWSTMLEIKRRGRMSKRCRVLVNIRNTTGKACGALLVHTLQAALEASPNLDLTIAHGRGFDHVGDRYLDRMLREQPDRVQEYIRPSRQQRIMLAEQHEWTFWTAIAESAGCVGLESLACGTPLIGFDVPLVSTVVKPKQSGWLISCDIDETDTSAPIALPSIKHTLDAFREITNSRDLLDDLRGHPWDDLAQRHTRFKDGWSEILCL